MYKNDKVTRGYSEPFKLKILAELKKTKYQAINIDTELTIVYPKKNILFILFRKGVNPYLENLL